MKDFKLKQRIYWVINDRLSVKDFEKDLYYIVEIKDLKLNNFLFDLVEINYRSNTFKNKLLNVFNKHFESDEYLAITIFELSKLILDYKDINKVLEIVKILKEKCIELDFSHEILIDYYICFENYSSATEIGANHNELELINEVKSIARRVFDKYYKVKEFENWLLLLEENETQESNYEEEFSKQIQNYIMHESLDFKSERKIKNDFKNLGFSDFEIEESFLNSKEELKQLAKEKALPILILGVVFSFVGIVAVYKIDKNIYTPVWFYGLIGLVFIYSSILLYVKSFEK